jgi:molecular chaperone DnaK
MSYRLGVDLGTTFTAAAVANGGPPTMLGLGNRALQVPSVLYLPADGDTVVGEAAERRGATDPTRVVREFKRRIGDSVPILVAGVPYSPQALTAQLLNWVVRSGTDQLGEPPDQVILTYPANWGPYKRELLTQVVQLADVGEVTTCSEPEAAAVQYAAKSRVPPGARIAMYDLGGGTFDTCVLEKQADGFVMLGEPIGIEHLGGIDFDDAVFQHVLESLGDTMTGLDPADPQVQTGLARLRRDCVDAKEALSTDVQAIIPVSLPGRSTSVRFTRSELEELVRPPLEETVSALGRALRSANLEPADLHAIVLVGGGSRIPLVRELLQQAYPVRTALDTHPKHDVALGAVQVGAATLRPSEATPVEAPTEDAPPEPAAENTDPTDVLAGFSQPQEVAQPVTEVMALDRGETAARPGPGALRRRFDAVLWSRLTLVAFVTAAVVFGAAAALLWPRDDPQPTPPVAKPTATGGVRLPASTPLTAQQLLVPLEIDDNMDIYLGDTSRDTPVERLTSAPGADSGPALSPDRASVIYGHSGKTRTLRVMAVDGTGDRPLFDLPAPCVNAFRPGWNPVDPTMLALACEDENGDGKLYLVNTSGRVLRELKVGQPQVEDPAFSPDGKQVSYWAGPKSTLNGGSIYTMSVDGGEPRPLTKSAAGVDADPAWSPNGQFIAFRRRLPNGTDNGNLDIFVVPGDGSQAARPLLSGTYDDQDPSWSPDGKQLAIKSNQLTDEDNGRPRNRAWLVDLTGTTPRLLWTKNADGEQNAPAWTRR